jgi:hypothetical protein
VIARFGRRLLEGLVALFALLGFAFVPLGEHTGLEHLKAIASTPAAERAARELVQASAELRQRLTRALVTDAKSRKQNPLPELPEPDLRPEPLARPQAERRSTGRLGARPEGVREAAREPENARIVPATSTLDASAPWQGG